MWLENVSINRNLREQVQLHLRCCMCATLFTPFVVLRDFAQSCVYILFYMLGDVDGDVITFCTFCVQFPFKRCLLWSELKLFRFLWRSSSFLMKSGVPFHFSGEKCHFFLLFIGLSHIYGKNFHDSWRYVSGSVSNKKELAIKSWQELFLHFQRFRRQLHREYQSYFLVQTAKTNKCSKMMQSKHAKDRKMREKDFYHTIRLLFPQYRLIDPRQMPPNVKINPKKAIAIIC